MGCSYRNGGNWQAHWQSKMERMQSKMDRMRSKMEGRDWWGTPPSSGNRAFDDYRAETLRRLEDEQREFKEFLERLRFAKDRSEFDQFMAERRNRPPSGRSAAPQPPQTAAVTVRLNAGLAADNQGRPFHKRAAFAIRVSSAARRPLTGPLSMSALRKRRTNGVAP